MCSILRGCQLAPFVGPKIVNHELHVHTSDFDHNTVLSGFGFPQKTVHKNTIKFKQLHANELDILIFICVCIYIK